MRVKDFDATVGHDLAAWLEISRSTVPATRGAVAAPKSLQPRGRRFGFRRLPRPESFERIRLNMVSKWLLKSKDACTVIAFTSRVRGEGVSTVVAGLACAFGAADPGEVLALDMSGSKRGVSWLLGIKPAGGRQNSAPDLPQWLKHDESLGIDIFVLAEAGTLHWDSPKIAEDLLTRLRPNYRTILIDAGALTAGWAACWLACSTYRVLVVDSNLATQEVLEHQRNELERSGIALDGSIVNKRTYHIPRMFYWLAR